MARALQGEDELLMCLVSGLRRAHEFSVGMALIDFAGLSLVRNAIESCLARGGAGRVLFGTDLPTDPSAIDALLELARRYPQFELRRFQQGSRVFHAKMCLLSSASGAVAVLGSSNLTKAGLTSNHESNVFLDDSSAVRSLAGSFEEHFLGAHSHLVEAGWLADYRRRWLKRKAALERDERLRRASTARERPVSSAPKGIAHHRFAFTGKVEGWPRERKLYPTLRRLGGQIASSADRIASADCLVHAEIPGGRITTKKLKRARRFKMPIITEEQFLRILEQSLRRSRRARSRSGPRRS